MGKRQIRSVRSLSIALLSLLILSGSGWAQTSTSQKEELEKLRQQKAGNLKPTVVSTAEKRLIAFEKTRMPASLFINGFHGFRPLIGGMPAGSGFVFGGGYIRGLESEYMQVQANARFSSKGYSQYNTRFEFPAPQSVDFFSSHVEAAYQDYTQLLFFGLGNDTSKDFESYYKQRTFFVRGGVTVKPGRFFEFTGKVGRLETETLPSPEDPSLGTVYPGVPGFDDGETDYNVFGGQAIIKLMDRWNFPAAGIRLRLEGWRYDDLEQDIHDSVRVVAGVEGEVPLGYRNRRLAFRFRTSHTTADNGHEVPFYLMETIGGAKTLRGFNEFRFRDTRTLLLNLEYRWEVWTYLDFAFFGDAGKVFNDYDDLNFKRLHTSFGWGIRLRPPGNFSFNIDLAKSKEGFVIHVGGGPSF